MQQGDDDERVYTGEPHGISSRLVAAVLAIGEACSITYYLQAETEIIYAAKHWLTFAGHQQTSVVVQCL